jgi:hypothetical protein
VILPVDTMVICLADPATRARGVRRRRPRPARRGRLRRGRARCRGPVSPLFDEFRLGCHCPLPGSSKGSGARRAASTAPRSTCGYLGWASPASAGSTPLARCDRGQGYHRRRDGLRHRRGLARPVGIDAEIVAETGGLQGDPAELEAARRARLLVRSARSRPSLTRSPTPSWTAGWPGSASPTSGSCWPAATASWSPVPCG